jgi:hypothetical protein
MMIGAKFGKIRIAMEKRLRDPDDVFIHAEERRQELARQGRKPRRKTLTSNIRELPVALKVMNTGVATMMTRAPRGGWNQRAAKRNEVSRNAQQQSGSIPFGIDPRFLESRNSSPLPKMHLLLLTLD